MRAKLLSDLFLARSFATGLLECKRLFARIRFFTRCWRESLRENAAQSREAPRKVACKGHWAMEEEMEAFQKRAEKQGGARWKARFVFFSFCFLCLQAPSAMAGGNLTNESFARAKRLLSQKVYMEHRVTLYCAASYDAGGNISLPEGFVAAQHSSRALRMEWEHIVPAENFGRSFREWREGHPLCTRDGKAFKGRSCAEKASKEYRRMHADMHNLAPAIGAVNAARKNHNFALLPEATSAFGSCPVKILGNKVEPPERARGLIARSYLYMQAAYPRYKMGRPQRQLMEAWNRAYPPDAWECTRARRIAALQGNANEVTERRCKEEGL